MAKNNFINGFLVGGVTGSFIGFLVGKNIVKEIKEECNVGGIKINEISINGAYISVNFEIPNKTTSIIPSLTAIGMMLNEDYTEVTQALTMNITNIPMGNNTYNFAPSFRNLQESKHFRMIVIYNGINLIGFGGRDLR